MLMIMEKLDYNQKLIGIFSVSSDLKTELLKFYNSLKFNKNILLTYNDVRKFGFIKIFQTKNPYDVLWTLLHC